MTKKQSERLEAVIDGFVLGMVIMAIIIIPMAEKRVMPEISAIVRNNTADDVLEKLAQLFEREGEPVPIRGSWVAKEIRSHKTKEFKDSSKEEKLRCECCDDTFVELDKMRQRIANLEKGKKK